MNSLGSLSFSRGGEAVALDLEQLAALVCWAIAAVFLVRAARILWRDLRLHRIGVRAEGEVVRVIEEYESEKLVIRFSDRSGAAREFQTDLSLAQGSHPVGARVPVRYDPARPMRAHLARPASRAFACALGLLSAGICAYLGVMMWRSPF